MIGRLASVGGFTALSRVAGFLRDVLMAAVLGAGPASDAFMVAFRLPNNFRAIFAEGAFSAAFLPRYAAAAAKDGSGPSSPAARFANDVFAWQFVGAARAARAGARLHAPDHRRARARLLRQSRSAGARGRAHAHHLSLSLLHRHRDAALLDAERGRTSSAPRRQRPSFSISR